MLFLDRSITGYRAWIGTNSVRGSAGIYTLEILPEAEQVRVVACAPAYNSGSLALGKGEQVLYAASEGMTFDGCAAGGVTAFAIGRDGSLSKLNGARSAGQRTCCVAADPAGRAVYGCDFYVGTWNAWPLNPDGSLRPFRLSVPPAAGGKQALHCIAPIDKELLAVISLAENALVVYKTEDGSRVTSFTFPEGVFARYLAVADGTIYAMLQMPDDIYVFENRLRLDGTIRHIQTIAVMDAAHRTMPATSTIRVTPDGGLVLAANRPSNSITVFSRNPDGTLRFEDLVVIPGNGPRDFNISGDGRLAVVAMQHSDEVFVLRVDYEKKTLLPLAGPVRVPSPAAVVVSGRCSL